MTAIGYPENLKGINIPYLARITTIADTFDAMTSARRYRKPLSLNEVKEEFKKHKGTQFDPKLTDIFLKMLTEDLGAKSQIQKKYK